MNSLLNWLMATAIVTVGLALVAGAVCRFFPHRPAVRHLLWLIVLVRFVLPPVLPWPSNIKQTVLNDTKHSSRESNSIEAVSSACDVMAQVETIQLEPASLNPRSVVSLEPEQQSTRISVPPWLPSTILLIWFTGMTVGLFRQLRRIQSYRQMLSRTSSAPAHLLNEIQQLSKTLGMPSIPVHVTDQYRSPFVWCFGWLRLVWPQSLSSHASVRRSRGILAHELVHVLRRDHWVAWIELIASVIWWWNPIYWFVRGRLRESAEMACDAIALNALPDERFAYAELFLELSSSSRPGVLLPVLGLSAGTPSSFERRLRMILSDSVSSGLSRGGVCAILALLGLAMPGLLQGEQKEFENRQQNTGKVIYLVDDDGDGIADRPATAVESEFIDGDPGLGKIYFVIDEDAVTQTKVRRKVTIINSRPIENGIVIQTLGKLKGDAKAPESQITTKEVATHPNQDPPTPDEVLSALPKLTSEKSPFLSEMRRQNVKIVVQPIRDQIDDWRVYPLVGPARLHHCTYKCTVYFELVIRSEWPIPFCHTKECVDVVYIDRDCLISKDKSVLKTPKLPDQVESKDQKSDPRNADVSRDASEIQIASSRPPTVELTEMPPAKVKLVQYVYETKWIDKTVNRWKATARNQIDQETKEATQSVVSVEPTTVKVAIAVARREFVLMDARWVKRVQSGTEKKLRGLGAHDSKTGDMKWILDLGASFEDLKSWSIDGSTVIVKFKSADPMLIDIATGTKLTPPSTDKNKDVD
ncbi:MAG: blaR1 2 [Schlesneria sp.]|nr:blaR1 2 [Schlesneria sp.]